MNNSCQSNPTQHIRRRVGATTLLRSVLLLMLLPAAVQAQFSYLTNGDNTLTITGYRGPDTVLNIPGTINGRAVTRIGYRAFFDFTGITGVTIPNSVTDIGQEAFYDCWHLAFAPIPSGVTNIGSAAFRYCWQLTGVTIPNGITRIEDYTFGFCISLNSVTVPNSVAGIGNYAFEGCTGLTSVSIPNSVTNIGRNAFDSCIGLAGITIPASVATIGDAAFIRCDGLTAITVDTLNPVYSSVAGVLFDKDKRTLIQYPTARAGSAYPIPDTVSNIQYSAFEYCTNLTSVAIPNSVISIGYQAFYGSWNLASVEIGNGVTSIGDEAFAYCRRLAGVYFQGNAPTLGGALAFANSAPTIYYLPGTTGWGPIFGGRPTALWVLPPTIQASPQTQTAEVGSAAAFRATAGGALLTYEWFFNGTTPLSGTNSLLQLTDVQYSQAGAYTVVVTNAAGSVTSAPAILSVIPPVERRLAPALTLMGQPGTFLNLDHTAALGPGSQWTTFDTVLLTQASQWYFDLTAPLPPQGFYRAWHSDALTPPPTVDLHFGPAITLTGNIGSSVRLDYINQFGPTDAWVTLATVTLTNTSQLYFDTSSIGQPPRLWRIVPLP